MYESPIELIYKDVIHSMEDSILRAVESVDIFVNKEELIKALEYDREQYRKGFQDGLITNTNLNRIVFCIDCKHRGYKDFNCYCESGPMTGIVKPWDYCSHGELKDELNKVVDK